MVAITRFPIFGKTMLPLDLYRASSSKNAFAVKNCALPQVLGQRLLAQFETNLTLSKDSANLAGDAVVADIRPDALYVNLMGNKICCPGIRGVLDEVKIVLLGVLLLLCVGGLTVAIPFLFTSGEVDLFTKVIGGAGWIVAFSAIFKTVLPTLKEHFIDLKRVCAGGWRSSSETSFLFMANRVALFTESGIYLSTELERYTNTFIPWSDIGSVRIMEGNTCMALLDHEGNEINLLYRPSTETMTINMIHDLISNQLTLLPPSSAVESSKGDIL